jgi:hypothetical protein
MEPWNFAALAALYDRGNPNVAVELMRRNSAGPGTGRIRSRDRSWTGA